MKTFYIKSANYIEPDKLKWKVKFSLCYKHNRNHVVTFQSSEFVS